MTDHCKDCRFWKPIEEDPGDGECSRMTVANRWHSIYLYANAKIGQMLVTPELFGCIQFEAKV